MSTGRKKTRLFDTQNLVDRISAAVKYLRHVEDLSSREQWADAYTRFRSGTMEITEVLALAHPCHFREVRDAESIRGPRLFTERNSAEWCRCQSSRVWGYECPMISDSYQADHLFPYQAGGPTIADNRIWLCPTHNRVKSSDIHLFPWEEPVPDWVDERLASIASRLLR